MVINGKNVSLRFVEESDAAFLVSLRTNEKLNRFLSSVDHDVEKQRVWIENYKVKEKNREEYYFIIEDKKNAPVGAVRVYDLQEDSFSWGSWIITPGKSPAIAIESAVRVYKFAFEELGYQHAHFEVMKGNNSVMKFHKNFGAIQTNEDDSFIYFENTKERVEKAFERYKSFWQ